MPGFSTPRWMRVAAVEDVPEDGTLQCHVNNHPICLYKVRTAIYATDDVCTHGEASLADGFIVEGDQIECPYHQGRFHIPTGRATKTPCAVDIKTYAVKVENGDVLMDVNYLVGYQRTAVDR